MWDALLEAIIDTAKLIPLLYLVYLIVEFFSHHKNKKFYGFMQKTKGAGPVMGSLLGIIPQCGFSSVMADLYSKRKITLGTLIAVFLATSDEALPLMLEYPEKYLYILYLLGIKLLCGIIFGYLIDIILSIRAKKKLKEIEKLNEPVEKEDLEHIHEEHCTDHECCADNIFLEALKQ